MFKFLLTLLISTFLVACGDSAIWNNPYQAAEQNSSIYYSSFSERPKHLDPARSYSSSEWDFISQIYEPPLQYHFLDRPYRLTTSSAATMPKVLRLNAQGDELAENADPSEVAFTEYHISIRPDIRYQPHPALAVKENGTPYYDKHSVELATVHQLSDFSRFASRAANAGDYIYQIKRIAYGENHSPIAGLMAEHIVGFSKFAKAAKQGRKQQTESTGDKSGWLDLRSLDMTGVKQIDDLHFTIRLKDSYPQFQYWLAMNFFAPMPWEAERFYHLPGMKKKNISLDWYPIGTGPYMLTENNPNLRMVLAKNPEFHAQFYPDGGEKSDQAAGFLNDVGEQLPFIDKAVYTLEKESIPRWNKFLQGFYDASGISSDSFDQAVQFNATGAELTQDMKDKNIHLLTAVEASTYYMGFNMKDAVVGGNSEKARLLRQAISIAVDYEEYISVFSNGRGIAAQSPLAPGIFGYQQGEQGINPVVYDYKHGKAVRKPIEAARALMKKAGYGAGTDPATGKALVLHYDTLTAGPDSKALLNWYRKQFKKLGIQLDIRGTDYNRFQEKMRKGSAQIFSWGWNADYPDPENFLFLLYGPNGKVDFKGENAANYSNKEFDALFEQMSSMPDSPQRLELIQQMLDILRQEAPWVFGFHPKQFSLYHDWYHNAKPNLMGRNTLKYRRIDVDKRNVSRQTWNHPVVWPLGLIIFLIVSGSLYGWLFWRRHDRSTAL